MADLNLVVAGASGRMGRTLIREIAQGSGITLCGALEAEGHPNLGMDSGTLAGMQANGITLTATTGMKFDCQADIQAQGLNITAQAQVGFTGKGSATAELSAAGQTTVKGALVMIN